jgi:phosphate transport system substrate-binding protein
VLAVASQSNGIGAEHLFIEKFATKSSADRLQADLTAELRKLPSVSLVTDESSADLVLGGGGEIWVKGYSSLNPRSGRLPANGTPVYGGYLSVELKNKSGITLWSDLVTPGVYSGDIAKELSKLIAKHIAGSMGEVEAPPTPVQPSHRLTILHGGGATFPRPVYAKWFANYQRENPSVEINYEAIGSEAGIRRLLAGDLDFGASDSPEAISALGGEEAHYLLFPSVVGAVVPIVNLPGVPYDIAFTPEALAGIFLGKIKKWNDPILLRANRGVHLPDLPITVIHRSDGSGTSYAFTDYLSKTSPEWKQQVGSSLAPHWPTGRGAAGNDGVAALVKELGGSIGYVEFTYSLQYHVSYGKVRNRNGEYVAANLESIGAAVGRAAEMSPDFKISIVDAPGPGAYPIASFTWLVVPARITDEAKRTAIVAFLRWMLGSGQREAAALGYLALPKYLIAREEAAIARIH